MLSIAFAGFQLDYAAGRCCRDKCRLGVGAQGRDGRGATRGSGTQRTGGGCHYSSDRRSTRAPLYQPPEPCRQWMTMVRRRALGHRDHRASGRRLGVWYWLTYDGPPSVRLVA